MGRYLGLIVILAGLGFAGNRSPAQMYRFYGHLTRNTVWSDSVNIVGDVVVDSGVTLTILPGSKIYFTPDTSVWDAESLGYKLYCDLIVFGTIKAIGTATDSIVFTTDIDTVNNKHWGSLWIRNSAGDTIEYSQFFYPFSAIQADNSRLLISNNSIQHSGWTGEIYFYGGILLANCYSSMVSDNSITDCRSGFLFTNYPPVCGIRCEQGKGIQLFRNSITDIDGVGYGASCAGIDCSSLLSSIISDNDIMTCIGGTDNSNWGESGSALGIIVNSCSTLVISDNNISNCTGGGGGGNGFESGYGGGGSYGIMCSTGSDITILNNRIGDCTGGHGEIGGEWGAGAGDGGGVVGISFINSEKGLLSDNIITNCEGGGGGYQNQGVHQPGPSGNGGPGIGVNIINSKDVQLSRNSVDECIGGKGGYYDSRKISDPGLGIGIELRQLNNNSNVVIGGSPENTNNITEKNGNYNVANYTFTNIIATYNWWGSTESTGIATTIIDHSDSAAFGYVYFVPFATTPGIGETNPNPTLPLSEKTSIRCAPNPSRTAVAIEFFIPFPTEATLKIFDPAGRLRATLFEGKVTTGRHTIHWNTRTKTGDLLPAGVYFCRLETKETNITKKIVRLE